MLKTYRDHVAERAALGIPPLPLSAKQTGELIELLKNPPQGEEAMLVDLITHRVPAGVDDAAKVKASYFGGRRPWHRKMRLAQPRKSHRVAGHHAGWLQPHAPD
jgi:aconitate hydratase 2 / 2-methylisocitrate dehydratase